MRLMIVGELGDQLIPAIKLAKNNGAKVLHVPDIGSCMNALRSGKAVDLLMVDVRLPIDELNKSLVKEKFTLPIVGCGISNDKEAAVKAIQSGAQEYLPLPPNSELIAAVFEMITGNSSDRKVIFESPEFGRLIEMASKVAPSEASILITGQSGTGKEVLARFIHEKSKRFQNDLVSVNCAAIPENLLESELFGHEKGAFTGAIERRIGKFEQSNHGTLLLDEISEMDVRLQAKLLRVLQEREIVRVGGSKPIKLSLRVIATSNRDLKQEVKKGTFREDLYFRLNVVNLHIPPLSKRIEDIEPLAQYFIAKYAKEDGIEPKKLSREALIKLQNSQWPGNVRELENSIHRALLFASTSEITVEDIDSTEYTGTNDNFQTLSDIERSAIKRTVQLCNNDYNQVAKVLGITIKQLREKLKEYEINTAYS